MSTELISDAAQQDPNRTQVLRIATRKSPLALWQAYLGWGVYFFNGTDFGRHSKESEYFVLLVRNQTP